MKQHFSEADLLETYYTQPGESMPVMMHLADCSECAARYERLERKLRGLAECKHDKPETFWARQRIAVMRKLDARRDRSSSASRVMRIAAAAVLVVGLSAGVVTWRGVDESTSPRVVENQPSQPGTLDDSTTRPLVDSSADPWQSDELKDLQGVVAWESWVEPEKGDKSL